MPIIGITGSQNTKGFLQPNPPTSVAATDVGTSRAYNNGAATVTFTPAASGAAATSFTATSSPGGFTATGASSPLTVTGLQSGVSYTFTVTGTNAAGTGAASSASSAITATTVPQAPTIGTATAGSAGSGQVSVAFTAGATGGKAVSTFTVTGSPGGSASGAGSPITVSSLTAGTAYTFTVRATNANGQSLASAASNSATPTNPVAAAQTFTSSTTYTPNYYPFKYDVYVRGGGGNGTAGSTTAPTSGNQPCSPGSQAFYWAAHAGFGGEGGSSSQATGQTINSGSLGITVGGPGGNSQVTGASTVTAGPNIGPGNRGNAYVGYSGDNPVQVSQNGTQGAAGTGAGGSATVGRINDWGMGPMTGNAGGGALNNNFGGIDASNYGVGGNGGNASRNGGSCSVGATNGTVNNGTGGNSGVVRLVPNA
jgi:hypothetical protein